MFQPNSLRALRELKLDKELEKNTMQFSQNNSEIKTKKSRSVSNTDAIGSNQNCNSSDFSEDDQEDTEQMRPQTSESGASRGLISNNSEYFQKMKSLLEKNPYHPMNFIFDHKDLLKDITQFIQETREWREQQKKDLEEQLLNNKQRAMHSVEENEELQKKIKEQQEFETYLEQVKQIQEQYNQDIGNYQKYMKKTNDKENRPKTGSSTAQQNNENENQELLKQIEDSKKKVSQISNIEEYLQKAQFEVEYNKLQSEKIRLNKGGVSNSDEYDDEKLNPDIKNDMNDDLMVGITEWEKQVDELLLNLNDKPNDVTLSSKQRIQSARQNLKKDYAPTNSNNDEIEKELEELDKEFQELEDMLDNVSTLGKN